jgi:hypothetical protein
MRPMGRLIDTDVETVNELLTNDHCWDVGKVRSIFFAPDAEAMLQIPLSMRVSEDVLAWAKEKSGEYSVRSAYRALVLYDGHEIAQGSDAVSSSMGDEGLWKKLWKINVVPKVRTFWWRVLKGFMPD